MKHFRGRSLLFLGIGSLIFITGFAVCYLLFVVAPANQPPKTVDGSQQSEITAQRAAVVEIIREHYTEIVILVSPQNPTPSQPQAVPPSIASEENEVLTQEGAPFSGAIVSPENLRAPSPQVAGDMSDLENGMMSIQDFVLPLLPWDEIRRSE